MKKIIVAALTLMLIFTVSVPAFADGDLAVSLPVVNANPGESISVPITISGLSPLRLRLHMTPAGLLTRATAIR